MTPPRSPVVRDVWVLSTGDSPPRRHELPRTPSQVGGGPSPPVPWTHTLCPPPQAGTTTRPRPAPPPPSPPPPPRPPTQGGGGPTPPVPWTHTLCPPSQAGTTTRSSSATAETPRRRRTDKEGQGTHAAGGPGHGG